MLCRYDGTLANANERARTRTGGRERPSKLLIFRIILVFLCHTPAGTPAREFERLPLIIAVCRRGTSPASSSRRPPECNELLSLRASKDLHRTAPAANWFDACAIPSATAELDMLSGYSARPADDRRRASKQETPKCHHHPPLSRTFGCAAPEHGPASSSA